MSYGSPQGGYKLVLVPVENIRTHSPAALPPSIWPGMEYITVSQDVLYQVVADVSADRQLRMSRLLYDQIEVVDPPGPAETV